MKNISLKAYTPYIAAIALFIVISAVYFMPEIFQNKSLYQHDIVTAMGVGQEAGKYAMETGDRTLWTNGLFGGMPMYQIAPGGPSNSLLAKIQAVTFLYLPSPAYLLFGLLAGAFLLFIALKFNVWMAALGAIAYTFSSYFFIIIEAGHIWKVMTLAYIPPTFAGIIWAYRGKYWIGASITAIYMALQIVSNHPQMTFYFAMMMVVYVAGQFIYSFKNKQLSIFFKATAVLAVAVAIAASLNITNLYHTYDYSKYSIRGGSELTDNAEDKTKGGLERSYATDYSYGKGETFTLLIPNAKGGASGYMGSDEKTAKKIVSEIQNNPRIDGRAKNSMIQQVSGTNAYWADLPFTSGPVYAGAFIVFLFVLGLFIVGGWFKWVLLISTIMSILLSWGNNFMWLTNLFLDYLPYYNKLRAVSSILVIAELCIPILAILALKEIVENPSVLKKKIRIAILKYEVSAFYLSLALTGGLLLLFIIAPTVFFSFFSQQEVQMFDGAAKNPQMSLLVSQMMEVIENVRISVFRSDAWRSLIIIGLGVALILLYSRKKLNSKLLIVAVTVLTLADMWAVNKRYLSGEDFKPKKTQMTDIVPKTPIDEEILKDKDLDYRVYNLTVSPFNDGSTSFYHKSIGGYHGAKLRRYQDIIERYLGRVNHQNVQALMGTKHFDAFNMLNTKYIIVPSGQDSKPKLLHNPNALGNAWFVDEIRWVDNADEEIAALADINPAKTAVIDKRFKTSELENFEYRVNRPAADSTGISSASIKLIEYTPKKLVYESNSDAEELAVFSEIYYPKGWQISIDGKKAEMVRACYVLRSMMIPAGRHTVEFRFDPESYRITENIAWSGYVLLFVFIAISVFLTVRQSKKKIDRQ
ncbi:MAG: YfhO family protein [Prevotellaceae bacterium]|nr:YfhO family protein [Prevotellaceae bacterium]